MCNSFRSVPREVDQAGDIQHYDRAGHDVGEECLNNDQINLTGYDIADTIKAIFSKYCEEICVMADSEFNDVGIDSLVFLVILCEIEESLNIRLNMEIMNFNEINTLNKLIEAILNQI